MRTMVSQRKLPHFVIPLVFLLFAIAGLLHKPLNTANIVMSCIMALCIGFAYVNYITHTHISFSNESLYLTPWRGSETVIPFRNIALVSFRDFKEDPEKNESAGTTYAIYFRNETGVLCMRSFDIKAANIVAWNRALQLIKEQNPTVTFENRGKIPPAQLLKLS